MIPEVVTLKSLSRGEPIRGVPGDLLLWYEDDRTAHRVIVCPKCGKHGSLADHDVVVVPEQGVTITPSCVCPHEECKAHFWVKSNRIEWC